MSNISRYWEKYKERNKTPEKAQSNDKQAYISFLEIQLERVTQSVRTCSSFSERIQTLQSQVNTSQEKLQNLTKLVKLQQSFADSQQAEIASLKAKIGAKSPIQRSTQTETRLQELQKQINQKPDQQSIIDLVQEVKNSIQVQTKNMLRDIQIDKKPLRGNFDIQSLQTRIQELENFRRKTEKNFNRKEIPVLTDQSQIEEKVEQCLAQVKDIQQFLVNTNEEIKYMPVNMKKFQDRISSRVSDAIDKIGNVMQDYVYKQESFEKKMKNLQKFIRPPCSQIQKSPKFKSKGDKENMSRTSDSSKEFKKSNRSLSSTRKSPNRVSLSPSQHSTSSMPISPMPPKRQGISVKISEKLKKTKDLKKQTLKKVKKKENKKSKLQKLYDELAAHRKQN